MYAIEFLKERENMKKEVKLISILLCLCFMVGLLTNCAPQKAIPSGGGDVETKLVVWNLPLGRIGYKDLLKKNPNDAYALATKKIIDTFEKENPGVKIELADRGWADELRKNILLALVSGQIPDVFGQEVFISEFAQKNMIAEIDISDFKDDMVADVLKISKYKGKNYGVPIFTGVLGLSYNTKLLKEAGFDPITPPSTWQGLLDMSGVVQKANDNEKVGGVTIYGPDGTAGCIFRFYPFLLQAGGGLLDENGKVKVDTSQNEKAFTYLRNLSKNTIKNQVAMSNWTAILSLIHKNQTAFEIESNISITFAQESTEKNVSWAPLPKIDDTVKVNKNVLIGTLTLCIPEKSTKKVLAQKFIKMMLRDEFQKLFFTVDSRLPVMKSVLKNPELVAQIPQMQVYIDELLNNELYPPLILESHGNDVNLELEALWKKIIQTNEPIKGLLEKTQKNIDDILKQ